VGAEYTFKIFGEFSAAIEHVCCVVLWCFRQVCIIKIRRLPYFPQTVLIINSYLIKSVFNIIINATIMYNQNYLKLLHFLEHLGSGNGFLKVRKN